MKIVKVNTISRKFLLFFMFFILLPLFVLSCGQLFFFRGTTIAQARTTAEMGLSQISANIAHQFQNYSQLTDFIAEDRQLSSLESWKNANAVNSDEKLLNNISELLRGYCFNYPDVEMTAVAFKNNIIFSTDLGKTISVNVTDFDWYRECMSAPDKLLTISYAPGVNPFPQPQKRLTETIVLFCAICDDNGHPIGVVMIQLYNQVLEQSMTNIIGNNSSFVYITNNTGKIVYSPVIQNIPEIKDKNQYLAIQLKLSNNEWTLHEMVYIGDTLQKFTSLMEFTLLAIFLITALMIGGTVIMGRSIVKPLHELSQLMVRVQHGDFLGRFQSRGKDEIHELGMFFNQMTANLQKSIDKVYISQKAKRKAEIAALQANIKPHFLYNTLDTVSWMARQYHADDIVSTINALSTFFRVSLSKGSDVIPISQEILHAESYLIIQKVRYEEKLSFEIHANEDCKTLMVQKMILQPLVENAIYHGIKESGKNGLIRVLVWKNDEEQVLYLAVEDDGAGMSPERLAQVTDSLHNNISLQQIEQPLGESYGVVNVNQRLLMNYGEEYSLQLRSILDEGTVVIIRHPIIPDTRPL